MVAVLNGSESGIGKVAGIVLNVKKKLLEFFEWKEYELDPEKKQLIDQTELNTSLGDLFID